MSYARGPPLLVLLAALALARGAAAGCPLGFDKPGSVSRGLLAAPASAPPAIFSPEAAPREFNEAAYKRVDWAAVRQDIRKLMTTSQPFWPADGGNYAGLFVRMAWHCAGTYRTSDGRGGCEGANLRFLPVRAWIDNANLDKALDLIAPIKAKHGAGLSWSDLIILTGTEAIAASGGPVLGFCGGRVDDLNGEASIPLGPSVQQEEVAPCKVNGTCQFPLGVSTVGDIYVNAAGPMGKPLPGASAKQIREVFARMGMNDSETVALIGGGHAFGKAHGACPKGPGPDPIDAPNDPWPGECTVFKSSPKGKGLNTFTSGFEGHWTVTPDRWSNDYFLNLLKYDWNLTKSPAGQPQWKPVNKPGATGTPAKIFMLTTDVALLHDPAYLKLVKDFAAHPEKLDRAFSHAWYKLVTRDRGPRSRCLPTDERVPAAQPFQNPLPPAPERAADYARAARLIRERINAPGAPDTNYAGKPTWAPMFAQLAWRCAATFRKTDYNGGCSGARIRFAPEKDWPMNKGLDAAIKALAPVKDAVRGLSWSDLIVLAGQEAMANAGANALEPFCGGRTDAANGEGSAAYPPRTYYRAATTAVADSARVMGLTPREFVALAARPRSPAHQRAQGYSGSYTSAANGTPSNRYFKLLLDGKWTKTTSKAGKEEYVSGGRYMTPTDVALLEVPEMRAAVDEFAASESAFQRTFASAWSKMMNAERYAGPTQRAACSARYSTSKEKSG